MECFAMVFDRVFFLVQEENQTNLFVLTSLQGLQAGLHGFKRSENKKSLFEAFYFCRKNESMKLWLFYSSFMVEKILFLLTVCFFNQNSPKQLILAVFF